MIRPQVRVHPNGWLLDGPGRAVIFYPWTDGEAEAYRRGSWKPPARIAVNDADIVWTRQPYSMDLQDRKTASIAAPRRTLAAVLTAGCVLAILGTLLLLLYPSAMK